MFTYYNTLIHVQDFVTSSDAVESAGLYDLAELQRGPINGASAGTASSNYLSSSGRRGRRRAFSTAAVIANASASTGAPTSATCTCQTGNNCANDIRPGIPATGTGNSGVSGALGHVISGHLETQFVHTLSKICETIEKNEVRMVIQERKDAIKLEWQQVTSSEYKLIQCFSVR